MKKSIYLTTILFLIIISCKNNDALQIKENLKDTKKKEIIFSNINKSWIFNTIPENQTTQNLGFKWPEWRVFLDELSKKPKSTIGAFQQKSKDLSKKGIDLYQNIPVQFNNPAIKSRITVLLNKINMLELYINLNEIPDKKVVEIIKEINIESQSLQAQMNKIEIKSKIKVEVGEQDLIKMLDTSRALRTSKSIFQ